MYVCMYVCMYACMQAGRQAGICVYKSTCTHVCVYIYIILHTYKHSYIQTDLQTYIYTCIHTARICTHIHILQTIVTRKLSIDSYGQEGLVSSALESPNLRARDLALAPITVDVHMELCGVERFTRTSDIICNSTSEPLQMLPLGCFRTYLRHDFNARPSNLETCLQGKAGTLKPLAPKGLNGTSLKPNTATALHP